MRIKIVVAVFAAFAVLLFSHPIKALNYGAGSYGSCTYGTCGITVSSAGTINLAITPVPGQIKCTVDKDDVSVTTGASVGYTMTISSQQESVSLAGTSHGGAISPVGSTYASPSTLTANTWGYRIDGVGNFGAGPTAASNSTNIPIEIFSPLAVLSSPQTIRTTSSSAALSETDIWYGACVNIALPADTYTRGVVYTAITN